MKILWFCLSCLFWLLLFPDAGAAQTLHLREKSTGAAHTEAEVGDTVAIEVLADLSRFPAAGIAFFITFPERNFAVVGAGGEEVGPGGRPFHPGTLFEDPVEFDNALVPRQSRAGVPRDRQLLSYAAVLGPRSARARRGSGLVASFSLVCLSPVSHSSIHFFSNPVHQSVLLLADGRQARRFSTVSDLEITVRTLTLVAPGHSWGQIKTDFFAP